MKPRLHMLGLAHTVTTDEFSHCAFTGKVKKFSPMMRYAGYEVFHYGVEGADSGANENIDVLSREEWDHMRSKLLLELHPDKPVHDRSKYIGDLANVGNDIYKTFNERLKYLLRKNVERNDIICLPFGFAHQDALAGLPYGIKVETGIGYPGSYEQFRVFESYAWYHYEIGRSQTSGNDYWSVIPNYFIADDWKLNETPSRYVAYFGRLEPIKGLDIVHEVARHRPDLTFILCGQGDPTPYLTLPNVIYQPPIHGTARSDFLGNALAVLMPTRYVEPFGGVTVEAQLCGTPVLGSSWGSFTETIEHGVTGYRCKVLGDFLAGLEAIENGALDRKTICEYARAKYDYKAIAPQYDAMFTQLQHLQGNGWYTVESPQKIFEIKKAVDYSKETPKSEWANKQLNYWKSFKDGTLKQDFSSTLLLGNLVKIFDRQFKEDESVVDIGGGPFSILAHTNAKHRFVVDPTYYGSEVDQEYESIGIQYIPQIYESFNYKFNVGVIVNSLSSFESIESVLSHAIAFCDEVLIADLIDIELYNNLCKFIDSITDKTVEILEDKPFNNKKLVAYRIK